MTTKQLDIMLCVAFIILSSVDQVEGAKEKQSRVIKAINVVKRVANHLSGLVVPYVPPVVRECMWELTCLITEKDYSKCAWYVIRCVTKHVTGLATCLYDLGGDVAINIAYHGEEFWEYDYGQIVWDVLTCAGVDKILNDFGMGVLKKMTD